MKKVMAINGYTIYEATTRDEKKYNVISGEFYLYFSSDIRDFGLLYSEWEYEAGTIEEAEELANGSNYAIAKEIIENQNTFASFEEIEEVENELNSGKSVEQIEWELYESEEDLLKSDYSKQTVSVKKVNALEFFNTREGAENSANYTQLKIGDSVRGYEIAEIYDDFIAIEHTHGYEFLGLPENKYFVYRNIEFRDKYGSLHNYKSPYDKGTITIK